MEILLAALVAATVSGIVTLLAVRFAGPATAGEARPGHALRSRVALPRRGGHAPQPDPDSTPPHGEHASRRDELTELEARLQERERALDVRQAESHAGARALAERKRDLNRARAEVADVRERQLRELERIAGLSAGEARRALLEELDEDLRHEQARLIRQVEDETRHEADRRARSILAACMQRVAGPHSTATTVSMVALDSDELKGRIIGREGRNIRTLESLTGVDVIVDDTPGTVVLSSFDGIRREIARITLEKLLEDGRIHPARIEESYEQACAELDRRIVELGEQATLDARVGTVDPELTRLLGRLRFRTSYGQNVLSHSVECARLAALTANELGANPKVAARAALLHDVGKAVSHEVEGPHALVGAELARRHKESEAVAHAVEAHHNEVDPQTVEAVIVQIVDALSGARPGARDESLEHYVARLHDLEGVAARHPGVDKVYAMHAGRELRLIVKPDKIDDDGATLLSREIAHEVERELEYPGQIKVTVIRESRATTVAH
jgi:ribonucrease Y